MIEGFLSLFLGMRRLFFEASLRAVLWRIVLLLLVLMSFVGFGTYSFAEYLAGLWMPTGDAWYWQALASVAWFLAVLLALFTGVISFTLLAAIAAAPWLDMLAERSEILQTGTSICESDRGLIRVVMQSLVNVIRPLGGLLLMGLLALAVVWMPLIGQVAAMLIWGYAGIRFLNYELIDVPASRRGWDFARRKGELTGKRFFWLGFGGLAMFLMLIPVVNLFVIPAAVVGLSHHFGPEV
ncbi:MAG: EI24 domain-containing protein [Mariprofundaceae bacterium]